MWTCPRTSRFVQNIAGEKTRGPNASEEVRGSPTAWLSSWLSSRGSILRPVGLPEFGNRTRFRIRRSKSLSHQHHPRTSPDLAGCRPVAPSEYTRKACAFHQPVATLRDLDRTLVQHEAQRSRQGTAWGPISGARGRSGSSVETGPLPPDWAQAQKEVCDACSRAHSRIVRGMGRQWM
ncbi:MAG: hypothetical protein QOE83_1998 [Actinomycetota bacterium]|nr:hypothetical protein [Actinomycetota bacterium]